MLRTPSLPLLAPAALALLLAVAARAEESPRPAPAAPSATPAAPSLGADTLKPGKPAVKPYLAEGAVPDAVQFLPSPPAHDAPLDKADRAAFSSTRALKGTPRWELAANDVSEGAAAVLENFACVLGTRIDQARVPAVINLLERARLDLARATRGPKVHYRRLRPFVGNEAPICVQRSQALADSFSYPSGHATQGWAYALILASLVPEKATPILARGRAYGESRIVCGVHWLSDVAAGRLTGTAVFAALMGDATFRADLDRARAELRAALAGPGTVPDQAACTREATALREPPIEF
ncbi:acid phosphatase [Methylobacterium radiotolerans]|uniref:acid phosphatase n=1 Tax=Methylobacterium radiotolerans TaxID=31998 RepID=UPI001A0991D9|nr:phosphatase PAP2 family protein [Methylobacterium radiotolerans]MBE7244816.1 phosphatase PAP2 family protein [Actinomycetospora chiangmaiensis]UIY40921.1 phosphatase PAP2 family protein [Methylobacterium radiotolerans]